MVAPTNRRAPSVSTGGNVMLLYSVDVAGCGQRKTYRVQCPAVGGACFVP